MLSCVSRKTMRRNRCLIPGWTRVDMRPLDLGSKGRRAPPHKCHTSELTTPWTSCFRTSLRSPRWGPNVRRAEPRPVVAEIRQLDEVITFIDEAQMEKRQIDRAITGIGIVQNLKEEENAIVTGGAGSKAVPSR